MKRKHLWLAAIIALTPSLAASNEEPDSNNNGGSELPDQPNKPDFPGGLPDYCFPKSIIGSIQVKDFESEGITETTQVTFKYNDNGLLTEVKTIGHRNSDCNIRYDATSTEYNYYEDGMLKYFVTLTINNGLGENGYVLDHEGTVSEKSVLSYEYDDTKHLIRTSVKEEKEPSVITDLTWKADNLTTVTWLDGNILREDRARYQLGYYNSFNLDLNWLLLDSEGWEAAAGDPTKLFGLCRLTGKGSILLASEVSYYDEGHVKTMRYEFKNVNDEFFVILRYNDSNRLDREYTLSFLD